MQRRAIAYEQHTRREVAKGDRIGETPSGPIKCVRRTGVVAVNLPDEFGDDEVRIAVLQVAPVYFVDRFIDLGEVDPDAVEVGVLSQIREA